MADIQFIAGKKEEADIRVFVWPGSTFKNLFFEGEIIILYLSELHCTAIKSPLFSVLIK